MVAKKKQKSDNKAKPVLTVKLEGPGIRKGRVPIPDLVRICRDVQDAINKQAEALQERKTYHPGPIKRSIQEDCTLELIGIRGNSPTSLEFDFRRPQRALDFVDEPGMNVIRELGNTISNVRKKRANGLDPGVLLRVYSLTGVITPKGISRIELVAPAHNGHAKSFSTTITKSVRNSVAKRLSAPRTIPVEVDGVLEMADFKREDYKCRIDPAIGPSVMCTFDPQQADEIYGMMRRYVRVSGSGTIHPYTDKIDVVHIDTIIPLTPDALGDESFFANPSLSELMENVQPLDDPSILVGGIPADEDVDEMLRVIYEARK